MASVALAKEAGPRHASGNAVASGHAALQLFGLVAFIRDMGLTAFVRPISVGAVQPRAIARSFSRISSGAMGLDPLLASTSYRGGTDTHMRMMRYSWP